MPNQEDRRLRSSMDLSTGTDVVKTLSGKKWGANNIASPLLQIVTDSRDPVYPRRLGQRRTEMYTEI